MEWVVAGTVTGDSTCTIAVLLSSDRGVCWNITYRRLADDSWHSTCIAVDLEYVVDCLLANRDDLIAIRAEEVKEYDHTIPDLVAVCLPRTH